MSEEQKNKQSSLKKTIFGLVAIFALILGVWFGIAGVEERQAEQALQAAKEAAEANVTGSGESNQQAGDDVAFMLAMKLNDLNGESQTVSSQLAKVTLVNFWATWCAPCREEMPVFNAIHQKYQDKGFGVLGLTIDNLHSTAAFVQQLDITYPILMAEDEGWNLLSQTGNPKNLMPYSFLIDQNGKVLETKLGPLHAKELEQWVAKYL